MDDDFNMPDVKSMKSQWETAGPVPAPKVRNTTVTTNKQATQPKQPPAETGTGILKLNLSYNTKKKGVSLNIIIHISYLFSSS